MSKTNMLHWLPATTYAGRRAVLAIAGLGLITGMSTSPLNTAGTAEATTSGAAVAQSPQAGAPAAATTPSSPAGNAAAKAQPKAKAPSAKELMPQPVTAPQQSFTPSAEQVRNAEVIVKTGQDMKLSSRAQVIAVATALQESTLHNYGYLGALNDHDSQGLFQQRPSAGWGSPEQITDPKYAATKFYQRLVEVEDWDKKPLTETAQTVQVSAYPNHYAKWEKMAADLVLATYGTGPYADVAKAAKNSDSKVGTKVYKDDKR